VRKACLNWSNEWFKTELRRQIELVTDIPALRAAEPSDRWGKGVARTQLNVADCFAYEIAMQLGCPLLYVGDDFSKTDVEALCKSGCPLS
jgi:uncharacterized protein with PIN domain